MFLGTVATGPDYTDYKKDVSDPRRDVVQVELLPKQEVVEHDHHCAKQGDQEWLVGARASGLVDIP